LRKSIFDKSEETKQAGRFTFSGKELHGELTLAGANTSLYLHDKEHFNTRVIPDGCITGVLHDLTKISLIDCIAMAGTGYTRRGNERYFGAKIFPHYVICGDEHIHPADETISEISFVMDDASTLFYDFDAFGSLIDANPFIEQIVHANNPDRPILTGPHPQILYFTGKYEIFSIDTVFGKISASHNPSGNFGGPGGIRLDNAISVTIAFENQIRFHDAMVRMSTLLSYLGLLVGRPQNLIKIGLRIKSDNEIPEILMVICSMPPHRDSSNTGREPHPSSVLLDVIRKPQEFSQVTANWLAKQQSWHDARMRFFASYSQQRSFTIDRLIGAANMFDILPTSAIPSEAQLTENLRTAKDAARKIFSPLPPSPERDSILGALGRIGKSNLKQKIRYRAGLLTDVLPNSFPELVVACDEAVNCRNHYVHGSKPSFDYSSNFDVAFFFIETLEFVFGASDLIEAGWDIKSWVEKEGLWSHPFGEYHRNYSTHLNHLKSLLV
jgi:hypothetical protein